MMTSLASRTHRSTPPCVAVATLFLVIASWLGATGLAADDWPSWRGDGDAIWSEAGLMQEFPANGLEVRWRTPIKEGYAGPAVSDGRVFVSDFERIKQTGRLGGRERALALDEETGEVLWTHSWNVNYSSIMASYAEGPRAVPTVDGNHVYFLGAAGHLICLDVRSGEVLWMKHYPTAYDVSVPVFGFSSTPIVRGDSLIAIVGGAPDALVVAFDKRTGKELWRSLKASSEPGYSQPTIVRANGRDQLIIWHPQGLAGLDPDDGTVLWSFAYEAKSTLSVATPVVADDRVFVTQFYGGSLMLELIEDERGISAQEVWKLSGRSEMPDETVALHSLITTPIFDGETIWGIDSYGELRALDAATGERLWTDTTMVRQGRWGSAFMVAIGDRWLVANDQGELIICRLDREAYQELSRTTLIEPTTSAGYGPRKLFDTKVSWAHPAFANQHVLIRNDREILSASLRAP